MTTSKRNLVTWAFASALVVALSATGCGNRVPASPIEDAATESPEPIAETPTPTPSTGNPGYEQPPIAAGSLVVSGVTKEKTGIFNKTYVVKGMVMNTSTAPLSGVLKIDFKKNSGIFNKTLKVVKTETQVLPLIQPGQSFPFSVSNPDGGIDDAEVTVPPAVGGVAGAVAGYPAYPQAPSGTYGY